MDFDNIIDLLNLWIFLQRGIHFCKFVFLQSCQQREFAVRIEASHEFESAREKMLRLRIKSAEHRRTSHEFAARLHLFSNIMALSIDIVHKISIANSIETILPDQTLQPTSFTCPNRIVCRNYADIKKTSWIILQLSVSLSFCYYKNKPKV